MVKRNGLKLMNMKQVLKKYSIKVKFPIDKTISDYGIIIIC